LSQAIGNALWPPGVRSDERFGDQVCDTVDDIGRGDLGAGRDRACRLKRETAGEDCQTVQHFAFGLGEQVVAPVERRPQCLVTRQRRPVAA
jgi:hypothetical protein